MGNYFTKNPSGQTINPRVNGGLDTPWLTESNELTANRISNSGSSFVVDNLSLGLLGFDYISGSGAGEAGSWFALKAMNADAVLEVASSSIGDHLTASTIEQSDVLYGNFTLVSMSSGELIAYRHNL